MVMRNPVTLLELPEDVEPLLCVPHHLCTIRWPPTCLIISMML